MSFFETETFTYFIIPALLFMARIFDVPHLTIKTEELKNPLFFRNSPERCYYCKRGLFAKLIKVAKKENLPFVLDGTNSDDDKNFRPGMRAAKEFKIKSPLKEVKLTKKEIRKLSKNLNLPTWNKPSLACLATRFPYGRKITRKDLAKIFQAEKFLSDLGIQQVRVRHHHPIARIEVLEKDIPKIIRARNKIISQFKNLGYNYITLDLEGYRSGSMNPASL